LKDVKTSFNISVGMEVSAYLLDQLSRAVYELVKAMHLTFAGDAFCKQPQRTLGILEWKVPSVYSIGSHLSRLQKTSPLGV
jgi:hypothetical protein